ncbi:hypothetical protein AHF37_12471 [Paragonimus kellicotti]|nr:hypothetical protein AHF37_12471 [Paragonimus kellicotti]
MVFPWSSFLLKPEGYEICVILWMPAANIMNKISCGDLVHMRARHFYGHGEHLVVYRSSTNDWSQVGAHGRRRRRNQGK